MQKTRVSFKDLAGIAYSPALLLDGRFDVTITDDPVFDKACEAGFDAFFESMYQHVEGQDGLVFVEREYTLLAVKNEMLQAMLIDLNSSNRLAWRAGFLLGWLSALALGQRDTALYGLGVLRYNIKKKAQHRPFLHGKDDNED